MTLFTYIRLKDWRQFGTIDIDLTNQTTILTGTNGSGKTTLLNTLGHHFGWNLALVSTPFVGKKRAKRLWSDIYVDKEDEEYKHSPEDIPNQYMTIGHIGYDEGDGTPCTLTSNRYVEINYQLNYTNAQSVSGLFIPSHRPVATYHAVDNIPTDPVTIQQQYQQYQALLLQAFGSQPRQNPGKIQKQSLISLALFGEGNTSVIGNPEFKRVFDDFQEKLRLVLPKNIGFRKLEIRMPEVVICTERGDFSLDAMSGGINAIFGMVWQIFMFSQENPSFAVIIDEPENHLHPSMQRMLLPNLADAFRQTRFIVATHSPFIVSSFQDAAVYGLFNNERGRIDSTKLDTDDLSGTPNQVLREVLDVDSNLPVWVEDKIRSVINNMNNLPSDQRSEYIMKALSEMGIADAIGEFGASRR